MAEDSSFEGWTTHPTDPTALGFPTGYKLPEAPARGHLGELRTGTQATADTIRYAARRWPQRDADDFEREGRTWTDRGTGEAFKLCRGNPLLGDDPDAADAFVVKDDQLLFLLRADAPTVSTSVHVGSLWGTE